MALDYSQIELRLAAILSGDEKLCEIFRNGRDVHQEVAAQVFHVAPDTVDAEMRRRAKIINFGILYGMGVNALRAQLGSTTAEAHAFMMNILNNSKHSPNIWREPKVLQGSTATPRRIWAAAANSPK